MGWLTALEVPGSVVSFLSAHHRPRDRGRRPRRRRGPGRARRHRSRPPPRRWACARRRVVVGAQPAGHAPRGRDPVASLAAGMAAVALLAVQTQPWYLLWALAPAAATDRPALHALLGWGLCRARRAGAAHRRRLPPARLPAHQRARRRRAAAARLAGDRPSVGNDRRPPPARRSGHPRGRGPRPAAMTGGCDSGVVGAVVVAPDQSVHAQHPGQRAEAGDEGHQEQGQGEHHHQAPDQRVGVVGCRRTAAPGTRRCRATSRAGRGSSRSRSSCPTGPRPAAGRGPGPPGRRRRPAAAGCGWRRCRRRSPTRSASLRDRRNGRGSGSVASAAAPGRSRRVRPARGRCRARRPGPLT